MEVTVYGPLRSATDEKTVSLDVEPEHVRDVLDAFIAAYPRAGSQLYTDDGSFRPSVRVMCDGERADPDDACPVDADIAIFPAMQGGGR